MLLEFVRPDHVIHMQHAVLARLQTAQPEPGTVEDQLVAAAVHVILVPGADVVLPDPEGHVGCDMDLDEAAPDLDGLAGHDIGTEKLGGDLAIVQPGALPRELRAFIAVAGGFRMCPGKGQVAVFLQTAGNLRHAENKVGQEENLRIPEGVALIALAGKPLGADIHPVVVRRGHQLHMVLGKAKCEQIESRAVDCDRYAVPDLFRPGQSTLGGKGVKPRLFIPAELLQAEGLQLGKREAESLAVACGEDGRKLFHHQGLPRGKRLGKARHHPAADNAEAARRIDRFAVQGKAMHRADDKVNIRLDRARRKLQHGFVIIAAGLSLAEVLRAVVGHPPVDARAEFDGGILLGPDGHFHGDAVQTPQRHHPLKAQRIHPAGRRAPSHLSGQKPGADIQRAPVAEDASLRQIEALAVQRELDVCHVGGVRKLGDFLLGKTVEGACNEKVARLTKVALFRTGTQAQIAVAEAEIRLDLAQCGGIKICLGNNPVADPAEIQHLSFPLSVFCCP